VEPLAEPSVDFVLIRLWVISPQVLAHEVEARAEQVERRLERVARRRHTEIVAPGRWSGTLPYRIRMHLEKTWR